METYGAVKVQLIVLWTSVLDEASGKLHALAALPPKKNPPIPTGE
jgi:hypothetical protein